MRLEGSTYMANLLVKSATVVLENENLRFSKQLDLCLLELCRQLEVPLSLWLDKNTREFARFHQTIFFAEQFTEPVSFARMQIRWLE